MRQIGFHEKVVADPTFSYDWVLDVPVADLTKADFQKASFTTKGKNAHVDFSGAKLNDANFNDAVVKASGENSAVKNDPTA